MKVGDEWLCLKSIEVQPTANLSQTAPDCGISQFKFMFMYLATALNHSTSSQRPIRIQIKQDSNSLRIAAT